jgi:hypothetical protein
MTVARDRPDSAYDSELPILAELEAELELELELNALSQPPRPASHKTRLSTSARITRRALLLVALISLAGGSALAGRDVLAGSPASGSEPALLSSGGHGADRWQLEAYVYEGSICYALFVADTASSACGAPSGEGVRAMSALSSTRRFVVGLAGAGVTQVLVRVGRRELLLATSALSQAPGARRAKLTAGLRWFLARLPGGAARQTPARVVPRDGAGRPVGPAVLDCSLGAGSSLCQQAAGRISGVGGDGPG